MSVHGLAAAQLGPQEKAALIYAQARGEMSGRLWQAALGETDFERDGRAKDRDGADLGFDTLIALLSGDQNQPHAPHVPRGPMAEAVMRPAIADSSERFSSYARPQLGDAGEDDRSPAPSAGLGVNGGYAGVLGTAAQRTGIPAPALAAIVHAEAAKGSDGRWLTYSRNPRSSAAGLGQFLSGTWIGEAERPGTWLHETAAARGWLDSRGRVSGAARSELLALRYDGAASIQAIADYARTNLDRLRDAGVTVGASVSAIAQSAYVTHHLGLGDAIRFLGTGLDSDRARLLLRAQIGGAAADSRIAEAGNATAAHRDWLMGFVSRNIRPERFSAGFSVDLASSGRGATETDQYI